MIATPNLTKPIFQGALFGLDKCVFRPVPVAPVAPDRPAREYFPRRVHTRLVWSGDYFEFYRYAVPLFSGYPRLQRQKRFAVKLPQAQEALRSDNVKRTRQVLRRLVNSNDDLTKFVTLTYGAENDDLKKAYRDFNSFIKRLKYHLNLKEIKFICVPEIQLKREKTYGVGVWHFHLLMNLPYIHNDELGKIWKHGHTKIRQIDYVTNVGAYISKYLGKENFDKRFFRQKKFVRSQNLEKPKVIENSEAVETLKFFMSKNLHLTYQAEFDTKWLGSIEYEQFVLYAEKCDFFVRPF